MTHNSNEPSWRLPAIFYSNSGGKCLSNGGNTGDRVYSVNTDPCSLVNLKVGSLFIQLRLHGSPLTIKYTSGYEGQYGSADSSPRCYHRPTRCAKGNIVLFSLFVSFALGRI